MKKHVLKIVSFYERFERPISSLSLIGGFVFDALTLKRVDLFWENVWVFGHIVIAALGILALNVFENHAEKRLKKNAALSEKTRSRVSFWLIVLIQFAFGGLLSTFLVFYFRSASLASSWPFLLLLTIVFICNESFKHHYSRLSFQTVMLFVSIYSFAIFFVPVLLHRIGDDVFLISGAVSVMFILLFIFLLRIITRERFRESWKILFTSIVLVGVLINVGYFYNFIPPIPLSLKDAGPYFSVSKNSEGNYDFKGEDNTSWFSPQTLHLLPGEPLYFYSAVFAPTELNTRILHRWQYYSDTDKKWITSSLIPLSINGGRDDGYRTYSIKSNIFPGLWRVRVENERGQVIGSERFLIQI